jgi:ribonuclease HII
MGKNTRNARPPLGCGHEAAWRRQGYRLIAGIDEAGRGPLAGPVVAVAVILPVEVEIPPVDDSKKLTPAAREALAAALLALPGFVFATGIVSAAEIDRVNILQATHAAMRNAVQQLVPLPDFALIDGLPVPRFPVPSQAIVHGDALCPSIAAASILAKVQRDRLLVDLDRLYPGYGFADHKGYGTAAHLAALRRLGPCPEHRRSFRPVQDVLGNRPEQLEMDIGAGSCRVPASARRIAYASQ